MPQVIVFFGRAEVHWSNHGWTLVARYGGGNLQSCGPWMVRRSRWFRLNGSGEAEPYGPKMNVRLNAAYEKLQAAQDRAVDLMVDDGVCNDGLFMFVCLICSDSDGDDRWIGRHGLQCLPNVFCPIFWADGSHLGRDAVDAHLQNACRHTSSL